ncbi:MAG TPA: zinc ribbon domain-containing protein [Gemmatimonadales bacterium]|nr:zinc ribbon domain-containing protein [Gemmatimonadales bacterium]
MLQPILRPDTEGRGTGDEGRLDDEGEDPEDDMSPRAVALRALKEIDFDRATGKLSDADYETLKAKYMAEALAALRAQPGTGDEGRVMSAPVSATRLPSPVPRPACPTHGPRPESDAQFCSECGRRLMGAPGYCTRCGTALEGDARYCHACGTRVAA